MDADLLGQLLALIERLRAESQDYQTHHEDGQLWYNRGYADGMVLGLRELGQSEAVERYLLDDLALSDRQVMAWEQAYRHGCETGYRETFQIHHEQQSM